MVGKSGGSDAICAVGRDLPALHDRPISAVMVEREVLRISIGTSDNRRSKCQVFPSDSTICSSRSCSGGKCRKHPPTTLLAHLLRGGRTHFEENEDGVTQVINARQNFRVA